MTATPDPLPAGPPEPNSPETSLTTTERPHPLTPLVRGWVLLVAATIAVGRELLSGPPLSGAQNDARLWILAPLILGIALIFGLASIATWWFTRFLIDDTELRIESGILQKSSKRIGFSRIQSVDVIQPFAARLLGLCELRIEAGGADSSITLRYLARPKAYALRDYLLSRAHGQHTTRAESGQRPAASALQDLSSTDRILVRIRPGQLVLGLLTSTDFLVVLGLFGVAYGMLWIFEVGFLAIGGLIPAVLSILTMVSRRVLTQFNYTLSQPGGAAPLKEEAPAHPATGLRITRGLTNLSSQSVPVDRIQGVHISQPALWRIFGFHRVDITVLGYANADDDGDNGAASSLLFPVASLAQVHLAIPHLLPGADVDAVPLVGVPSRARWLRPVTRRSLRHGWNEHVLITEDGLLHRTRDLIPHAKVQSVRLAQGPLQRRLHLATVYLDTTDGPTRGAIPHLDQAHARKLLDGELDRGRFARRAPGCAPGASPDRVGE